MCGLEQLDPFEINVHTEDMVLAVSMTAAGHARCVDCALRLVRAARHSGADCEYDGAGLWDKVHQRSRPFPGEYPWITAEQLLGAVATDPRCSRSRAAQMARLTVSLRFLRAATELFPAVPLSVVDQFRMIDREDACSDLHLPSPKWHRQFV